MEVVASLSQGRTAAAQCGLFTHKSVPVIFEPPCISCLLDRLNIQHFILTFYDLGPLPSSDSDCFVHFVGPLRWGIDLSKHCTYLHRTTHNTSSVY